MVYQGAEKVAEKKYERDIDSELGCGGRANSGFETFDRLISLMNIRSSPSSCRQRPQFRHSGRVVGTHRHQGIELGPGPVEEPAFWPLPL